MNRTVDIPQVSFTFSLQAAADLLKLESQVRLMYNVEHQGSKTSNNDAKSSTYIIEYLLKTSRKNTLSDRCLESMQYSKSVMYAPPAASQPSGIFL